MKKFVHLPDFTHFSLVFLVLCNQRIDFSLAVFFEDFRKTLASESLHLGTGLCTEPSGVCVKFRKNGIPVIFRDIFGLREVHIHDKRSEFVKDILPRRIYAGEG